MSQTETWTVQRLLEWTAGFLKQKGVDSPRLEAEILLAAAMNWKRIELYTNFDTEPDESARARYRESVKRRGAGEPVAYVVGFKEFYSIPLKVDRSVLIPRPETEQLVLETLDFLKTLAASPAVCDVGTGSGAIAVAVARNWPKSCPPGTVQALDIDPDALAVARENARRNGVADRIEFVPSDLLEAVSGPFDVIVGNLPYVSRPEYDALAADVRDFEPRRALLAGPEGTEVLRRLIAQAPEKLKSAGRLLLEASPMIVDAVAALLDGWSDVRIVKDGAALRRFVFATKK